MMYSNNSILIYLEVIQNWFRCNSKLINSAWNMLGWFKSDSINWNDSRLIGSEVNKN